MRIWRNVVFTIVLAFGLLGSAFASELDLKWTGTATGSIADTGTSGDSYYFGANGTATGFEIDATATGAIGNCIGSSQCLYIDLASASITIDDLWLTGTSGQAADLGPVTFNFETGTRVFIDNVNHTVGFGLAGQSGDDLFDLLLPGPTFPTWDLSSPFGPYAGQPTVTGDWSNNNNEGNPPTDSGGIFATTANALNPGGSTEFQIFLNPANGTGGFVATTPTNTVPEPSSILLLAMGLIALALATQRKRTSQE